jgi:hypothetical protein
MAHKKVKYRLELNFLSVDRDDLALETSSPIYTLEDGFRRYFDAIESEKCVDDKEKPVRAHLWEYHYKKDGTPNHKTLARNY